jgi:hypothetical protein
VSRPRHQNSPALQLHIPGRWHIETLEVQRAERKEGEPGQSDVCGLYAYVMTDAWAITGHQRYLDEACASLRAAPKFGFALGYQLNNTAWGAAAAARVAQITGDEEYREIGAMFVATLFHHALYAQSNIGNAAKYPTFLGISCLQDGAYLAIFEEHEICMALLQYLEAYPDLPSYQRSLITEYCRNFLHRGRYYYPDALPSNAIAPESQSGVVKPDLAIPLEDLHSNGPPAGGVGQEVYGAGAALHVVARFYHKIDESWLFCDVPCSLSQSIDFCELQLLGDNRADATIVVPADCAIHPKLLHGDERLRAGRSGPTRVYHCPADSVLRI